MTWRDTMNAMGRLSVGGGLCYEDCVDVSDRRDRYDLHPAGGLLGGALPDLQWAGALRRAYGPGRQHRTHPAMQPGGDERAAQPWDYPCALQRREGRPLGPQSAPSRQPRTLRRAGGAVARRAIAALARFRARS